MHCANCWLQIGEEWEQYGDIVREDFVDSYKVTLTGIGTMLLFHPSHHDHDHYCDHATDTDT